MKNRLVIVYCMFEEGSSFIVSNRDGVVCLYQSSMFVNANVNVEMGRNFIVQFWKNFGIRREVLQIYLPIQVEFPLISIFCPKVSRLEMKSNFEGISLKKSVLQESVKLCKDCFPSRSPGVERSMYLFSISDLSLITIFRTIYTSFWRKFWRRSESRTRNILISIFCPNVSRFLKIFCQFSKTN